MPLEQLPPCPLCHAPLAWDDADSRFECQGTRTQHCFVPVGEGPERKLMVTASTSGEDTDLFALFPWPAPE